MARHRTAGRESRLTRNVRHHERVSKGYAAANAPRCAVTRRRGPIGWRRATSPPLSAYHATAAERRDTQGGCGVESRPIASTPPSWWEEGWMRSRRGEERRR